MPPASARQRAVDQRGFCGLRAALEGFGDRRRAADFRERAQPLAASSARNTTSGSSTASSPRNRRRARPRGTPRRPRAAGRYRRRAARRPARGAARGWRAAAPRRACGRRSARSPRTAGEHVVQHEGEPFGRRQRLQHHQQRERRRNRPSALPLGARPGVPTAAGSGTCGPIGSSRRDLRDRSMSRQTRATTVVSQPPRLSTALVSARLSRSQASCTASSPRGRAQHAVGHRAQMGPVGLEFARPEIFLVHRSHSHRRVPSWPMTNETGRCDSKSARRHKRALDGEAKIMQARMNHPVMVVPDAMKALQALGDLTKNGLPGKAARTGASARQPDQRLQRLRRHAPEAGEEGRRDRRAAVRGRGLARGALLHRRRARRAGADGSADPAQRPRRPG
jgi:hypothetical protein